MFKARVKKIFKKSLVAIVAIALFLMPEFVLADTISELQKQKELYSAQAQDARESAKNKQNEANYIKNQIGLLNSQIYEAEYSLAITKEKIAETQSKIDELNQKIKEEEEKLELEKEKKNKIVSAWYMEGGRSLLMTLFQPSLTAAFEVDEHYQSIEEEIERAQKEIENLKAQLQEQKNEQDQAMVELRKHEKNQEIQKSGLENQKWTKNRLLGGTRNAIDTLKNREKEATAKINEIQRKIDQITTTSNWGGEIVSSNDSSWYYSQLWYLDIYLGPSPYTVAQYGCLITSLAMIAKYYGRNYNVPSAVNASSFNYNGGLLYTPIVSDSGSQAINWSVVDSELASGHPVVVGVALGVNMGNSYGVSHFIVLKPYSKDGNKYGMHDPIGAGRSYSRSQVTAMRIIR